ncbi:MAG: hypothetical protein AAFS02_16590 [Pseudomonadota bacterium]
MARTKSSRVRIIALRVQLGAVAIAASLLASSPSHAAGFGWYAILFDYETFVSDFDADLDRQLTRDHAELYGARVRRTRSTDGAVFDYIEANAETYGVEYPETFEVELMWHRALMIIVGRIQKLHPETPLRFLETGRRFVGPGKLPVCKSDFDLIHGSCRTYIMFTRQESETAFWQLTEYIATEPSFSDPLYLEELKQLRDIFKEATLKNKAVYIYGHD